MKKIIASLERYLVRRIYNKNLNMFNSVAIPVNHTCMILQKESGYSNIVCTIAGYVLERETEDNINPLPVLIVLRVGQTEINKGIYHNKGYQYTINSICKDLQQVKKMFSSEPLVDEKFKEVSLTGSYFIIASMDRLFNKTLVRMEKKKISVKIPKFGDDE